MDKTIKILIVDDEVFTAEDIKETLEEVGYQSVFRAVDYNQAINIIEQNTIDLVMLDINLNDKQTGIDLADYINKNYQIPFIFLTSYSSQETINQVKQTKPSGFLLKPYQENLLLASIEIALFSFYADKTIVEPENNLIETEPEEFDFIVNNHLLIKDNRNFIKITLTEILWFESDKNYVDVKTADRKYTIRSSLKKIMENLPDSFLKCHRQYIVNLEHITEFSSNFVKIDDFEIPISRNEQELILKRLKM